ncbi:MAG TPA: hypothetical protein DCO75_01125 [Fibrobacteres bacterium]|jgi:hypothetical protein|nr:hypothetical protein [Fibrobacterota bacterium]
MAKTDKKVLKFVTDHQEIDIDAGDIAIELHLDENVVQEALDSLKDQGLVEIVVRNDRTYWQLSGEESESRSSHVEVDTETVSFDLSELESAPKPQKTSEAPKHERMKSVPSFDISEEAVPMEKEPSFIKSEKNVEPEMDDVHDTDRKFDKPALPVMSPVMLIVIAVVVSVIISSIVAVMIVGGAKGSIKSVENTSSASISKTNQRIDELNSQIKALTDKLNGAKQQSQALVSAPPASVAKHEVKASVKPSAKVSSKATRSSKKKKSKPSYFPSDENSSSSSSEPASSSESGGSASSESSSSGTSSSESSAPASGSTDDAGAGSQ